MKYGVFGGSAGLLFYLALRVILSGRVGIESAAWGLCFGLNCGVLTVYFAERRTKVKTVEELNRPLTLFPPRG